MAHKIPTRSEWRRSSSGVLSEPYPRDLAFTSSSWTAGMVAGSLIALFKGETVTNIYASFVNNPSVTWSTPGAKGGLYDLAGNLLASTADKAPITTSGIKVWALSAPYVTLGDGGFYAVLFMNWSGATTVPTVMRCASAITGATDPIGTGSALAVQMTGQTDLPNLATFTTSTTAWWVGVS